MSKAVRAHLIDERGFNPEYVRAAGYWLLGVADAGVFNKGYFDQKAELWSRAGQLLATSHQIVYFRA